MKLKSSLILIAVLALPLVGCATATKALLTASETITPASTNLVAVATNAAGAVSFAQAITPAVTNTTFAPNPVAQGAVSLIGALPIPGAGSVAIVGGWLLTAFAAWRNKKLSVALVKGIDAGRQILQTTPEGQRLDAKFKDALIDHQEIAGVLQAAGKLVNQYTGDTVKPSAT